MGPEPTVQDFAQINDLIEKVNGMPDGVDVLILGMQLPKARALLLLQLLRDSLDHRQAAYNIRHQAAASLQ